MTQDLDTLTLQHWVFLVAEAFNRAVVLEPLHLDGSAMLCQPVWQLIPNAGYSGFNCGILWARDRLSIQNGEVRRKGEPDIR